MEPGQGPERNPGGWPDLHRRWGRGWDLWEPPRGWSTRSKCQARSLMAGTKEAVTSRAARVRRGSAKIGSMSARDCCGQSNLLTRFLGGSPFDLSTQFGLLNIRTGVGANQENESERWLRRRDRALLFPWIKSYLVVKKEDGRLTRILLPSSLARYFAPSPLERKVRCNSKRLL